MGLLLLNPANYRQSFNTKEDVNKLQTTPSEAGRIDAATQQNSSFWGWLQQCMFPSADGREDASHMDQWRTEQVQVVKVAPILTELALIV